TAPPGKGGPVPAGPAERSLPPPAVSGRAPPGAPLRPGSPVGHRPFSLRTAPPPNPGRRDPGRLPVPGCRSLAPGRPRSQNHGGRYFPGRDAGPCGKNPLHPGRAPPADPGGTDPSLLLRKKRPTGRFLSLSPSFPARVRADPCRRYEPGGGNDPRPPGAPGGVGLTPAQASQDHHPGEEKG